MAFTSVFDSTLTSISNSLILVPTFVLLYLLYNKFHKPALVHIPGPWLASYTKLWKLWDVYQGHSHLTSIRLHRKHGSLVRIGPNHISIADPKAIPVIYNVKGDFQKTAFFPIQSISWQKKQQTNLFSTRDPHYHREEKRKVASVYNMSSLLESEPSVDACTTLFTNQLRTHGALGKTSIDLGTWLQYYAFDVVGQVTFAQQLGFLSQGKDVDSMMNLIEGMLSYASLCGQVPELHPFLLGNPLFPILLPSMETWNEVVNFTLRAINRRTSITRNGELYLNDTSSNDKDMLSRWAAVKSSDPDKMSTRDIVVHLSANVFAGSGTTAIALRAIVYFLLRDPARMAKTVAEIDKADTEGLLMTPIQYKESIAHLPYLGAVIREAMRLHPSVGLIMERHVPSHGATICGKHIPGGTVVGINPWVVQRDPNAFPDPDAFIPERWIDADKEKMKEMEACWLQFGAGSRTCIGKNVSLMEMQKVIPELLRQFTIEMAEPEKEWEVSNRWFVEQKGLTCKMVPRK